MNANHISTNFTPLDETNMILIDCKLTDNTQCAVCGSNLEICTYRGEKGVYFKKIRCPKCGEGGWVTPK
ncbi:MAG: hypothetical protein ACTSUV_03800 [Candidatus Ranarchaeia archaeon]